MQNFVEDYTITYKNAILDSCLSGWLAGWLAVCGTQKGPTSLTTIAKKQQKERAHSATLATVAGIRQEVQQQQHKLPQKSEGVTGEPQDMKN